MAKISDKDINIDLNNSRRVRFQSVSSASKPLSACLLEHGTHFTIKSAYVFKTFGSMHLKQ